MLQIASQQCADRQWAGEVRVREFGPDDVGVPSRHAVDKSLQAAALQSQALDAATTVVEPVAAVPQLSQLLLCRFAGTLADLTVVAEHRVRSVRHDCSADHVVVAAAAACLLRSRLGTLAAAVSPDAATTAAELVVVLPAPAVLLLRVLLLLLPAVVLTAVVAVEMPAATVVATVAEKHSGEFSEAARAAEFLLH